MLIDIDNCDLCSIILYKFMGHLCTRLWVSFNTYLSFVFYRRKLEISVRNQARNSCLEDFYFWVKETISFRIINKYIN